MVRNKKEMKLLGNVKIYVRKDYNNLFRVFRNEEVSKRAVVRRLSHLSAFAPPSPLIHYHTNNKLKENNLEIKSIFQIFRNYTKNAFNFIQKADYFQGVLI